MGFAQILIVIIHFVQRHLLRNFQFDKIFQTDIGIALVVDNRFYSSRGLGNSSDDVAAAPAHLGICMLQVCDKLVVIMYRSALDDIFRQPCNGIFVQLHLIQITSRKLYDSDGILSEVDTHRRTRGKTGRGLTFCIFFTFC